VSRIEFTPAALSDLDGIWDYIAADSPAAADRVVRHIEKTARQLIDTPYLGRPCPAWANGLRSFVVQPYPYLLFYRPLADGLRVVRILHGARDLPRAINEGHDA
jgi:toxin ParE1/3/4